MGSPPCLPQTFTRTYAKKKNPTVSQASCLQNADNTETSPSPHHRAGSGTAEDSSSQGAGLTPELQTIPAFLVDSQPPLHSLRESHAQHSTAATQELSGTWKDRQGNSPGFLLDTWAFTSTALRTLQSKDKQESGLAEQRARIGASQPCPRLLLALEEGKRGWRPHRLPQGPC